MTDRFITFEGGEGSGKSTQLAMLSREFFRAGIPYLATREPGGTDGAEEIRGLLLQGSEHRWEPMSEVLLFQAARIEHVRKRIEPALAENKWVLCDRFLDSTTVYQGIARKLGADLVRSIHEKTLGDFGPALTFLLDLDPAKGLARAQARNNAETRFENMDISFHTALREGFLSLAKQHSDRIIVVEADRDAETIHRQLVSTLKDRYNLPL